MSDQVFNNKSTFTQNAEFLQDVYIYGKLYYDFVGFGTDLTVEDINITSQANTVNLNVSGVSTFVGASVFQNTVSVASTATFTDVNVTGALDVDQIDVGIATVRERFELTNEDGTQHLVGFASGPRAGSVGIGSTLPDRGLDVDEIRVLSNIYDSVNNQGSDGFFLSRDVNGIRWVNATPNAQTDGFFVQKEDVLVGVGSFTTMNLFGNDSGGDLLEVTEDGTTVIIRVKDHWLKNNQGIHTTVNVGISRTSPEFPLDVDGQARFRNTIQVDQEAEFNDTVRIDDAELRVHNQLIVGTATTASFANNSGVATFAVQSGFATIAGISSFTEVTGFATFATQSGFATVAGISTFSEVAFAATFAQTAGIATFAVQSGFSTISGIATFAVQSGFSTISGIATFAVQSGFATNSGIATFAVQSGFATEAGFSTNAARAGIATFIETVQTLTDQEFFIPFVENSVSTGIETVRVDSGIRYNPARDNVIVGGGLTVGGATTIHNTLKVDSNTDLGGTLDVDGATTIDNILTVNLDVNVGGGLTVGGATTIHNTLKVDSNTDLDGTLDVDGATTIDDKLTVNLDVNVGGGLTVGGATTIHSDFKVDENTVLDGSLELNSTLIDINGSVATGKTDYRLSSVGTGVSWRPPGVETTNILYVTKDGNDSNTGLLEGDAKANWWGSSSCSGWRHHICKTRNIF